MKKIGIYAGTFDPPHNGHISFALQAAKTARLEKIYFAVEPKPRYKKNVTNLRKRREMINIAINNHPVLAQLALKDEHFSVDETLPEIQNMFDGYGLVMLFGSDVFCHIPSWNSANTLASACDFVVSVRNSDDTIAVKQAAKVLGIKPLIIDSHYPNLSSKQIRQHIEQSNMVDNLPLGIPKYIQSKHLYKSDY